MTDDILIRDLNRIVNDRTVSQAHRNVARRAVVALGNDEDSYDPDQTDFKANFDAMEEREKLQLSVLEVDCD